MKHAHLVLVLNYAVCLHYIAVGLAKSQTLLVVFAAICLLPYTLYWMARGVLDD